MNELYVPYSGTHPATVDINGHRLVILAQERDQLEEYLDLVGGDRIFAVDDDLSESPDELLQGLASEAQAQLVISPPDLEIPQVLAELKNSLPWPQ